MRIEWATICRYVETLDTGTTMVGVGMDTLEPIPLPTDVRLNAAIVFAMTYYEMQGADAILNFRVLAPDMNEIAVESIPFHVEGQVREGLPQGSEARRVVPMAIMFRAEDPGPYTLEFRVGTDDAVPLNLYVPPSPA